MTDSALSRKNSAESVNKKRLARSMFMERSGLAAIIAAHATAAYRTSTTISGIVVY